MTKFENEYWASFWSNYHSDLISQDEQSQVLRTRNKQPIDQKSWEITLSTVGDQLELNYSDSLLDLCCGNGLFTAAFSGRVDVIEAVDISMALTDRLTARCLRNVVVRTSDMRDAKYPNQFFSKVLWYAGIQYIDENSIVTMIRRIRTWMKPNGILMIGDIPDRAKVWEYFNDETRKAAYFDGLEKRKPIIGTWLEASWLENLCLASGFISANAARQHKDLIYSDFRFDLIART